MNLFFYGARVSSRERLPHYSGFTITLDTPHTLGLLWTRDQPDTWPHTQHSQQTDIHAPGGIRTHNPSKRPAVDPCLRPRCHWDRWTAITVHNLQQLRRRRTAQKKNNIKPLDHYRTWYVRNRNASYAMTNPSSIYQAWYSAQQVYYLEHREKEQNGAPVCVCAPAGACVCVYEREAEGHSKRVSVFVSNNKDELPVSGSYTLGICRTVMNFVVSHIWM